MGLDQQKIIRTLRLSLTCLFIFMITWYYQVPESAWALITIWFVMFEYTTVGGVFTKSFFRFSGTCLSAIYGMVIVYFCANNPLINMMALIPGLFVYAYFFMGGEKTYIGTIGAVTLTIVLLNYNDIDLAILRVFNIILGILGSMFMIRFFYPQYARDKIIEAQSIFLDHLASLLEDYLNPSKSLATIQDDYANHEHDMLEIIVSFNRLLSEAKMETKKIPLFVNHATTATWHLRHLFRLFNVFICYLSTNDIRSDLEIRHSLSQLLSTLRTMQLRLGYTKQDAEPRISRSFEIGTNNANVPNKNLIETILINMQKEAELLHDEIKKMLLIYEKKGGYHIVWLSK